MTEPARRTRKNPKLLEEQVATVTQSVTVKGTLVGEEKQERRVLSVNRFETEPAYVRVSSGVTKNMGNYQSLRVDVALTVPCYVEEIDKVFPHVADTVAKFLDEEVKNYEQEHS